MAVGDVLTPRKSPALATWRGTPGRSPSGQVLGCSLGSTGLFARTAAPELAPSPPPPQRSQLLTPPVHGAASAQPAGEQGRKYRARAGRDDSRSSSSGPPHGRLTGEAPGPSGFSVLRHPTCALQQSRIYKASHNTLVLNTSCRWRVWHSAQCLWLSHGHTSIRAMAPAFHVVSRQQHRARAASIDSIASRSAGRRCCCASCQRRLEPNACRRKLQRQPGGTGRRLEVCGDLLA